MKPFQKIYEIGKYALGILAIAALYSCTEPVNNQKPVKSKQKVEQGLDEIVNDDEFGKYDKIIELEPGIAVLILKKGQIVRGVDPIIKFVNEKKDGTLVFEYVEPSEYFIGSKKVIEYEKMEVEKKHYENLKFVGKKKDGTFVFEYLEDTRHPAGGKKGEKIEIKRNKINNVNLKGGR